MSESTFQRDSSCAYSSAEGARIERRRRNEAARMERKLKRIRARQRRKCWILFFLAILTLMLGVNCVNAIETRVTVNALHTQACVLEQQLDVIIAQQEELISIGLSADPQEPYSIDEQEGFNYLGSFTITRYCPCEKCCGPSGDVTASGTIAAEGRTVAVDPSIIPIGAEVMIGDQVYIAEDVGGAVRGNRIDVFMESHEAALKGGVTVADVFIK